MKETCGLARARPVTVSLMARVSGATDFKNFARTGALKNKLRTSIVVPRCLGKSSAELMRPPSILTRVPAPSARSHVSSVTRATDAIEGSASPRKPKVFTDTRSVATAILLVACRSKQRRASSLPMPTPSSLTRMSRLAPSFHGDIDSGRASIERVLDELLHDRRRSLHGLARRDLVRDCVWKDSDASGHGCKVA